MRTKNFFALAALIFLTFSPVFSAEPDEKLHQKCLYPVVIVSGESGQGGSGVIVRSEKVGSEYHNVILTCNHVIRSGKYNISVAKYEDWSTFKGYDKYPMALVAKNSTYDLAVGVFVTDQQMPTADIGFNEKLYMGTEVFRIGCGLLDEPRLDLGRVTAVRTNLFGTHGVIRTSTYTVPGDSGGPLFNNYKIVGITHMIRATDVSLLFGVSYSVPIGRLKNWDDEQNGCLTWVYTTKPLPVLPFIKLDLERRMQKN